MTAQTALLSALPGVNVQSPPEVVPTGFVEDVLDLDPIGWWRMNGGSASAAADYTDRSTLSWVTGAPKVQRTTLLDDNDAGASVDLVVDCLGTIPNHADHASVRSIFVACQLRDAGPKQQIVNRYEGANTAGRWLIEMTGTGQITAKLATTGGVVTISSSTNVVTKGVPFAVALTMGPAGMKLYVDSGTPVATHATTETPAGDRLTAVGAWYTGGSHVRGLVESVIFFDTQLSGAQVGTLMSYVKASGINLPNDDEITVPVSTVSDATDILANDNYQGTKAAATVVVTQGSLGTWAPDVSNDFIFTAGALSGTNLAMYNVNGGPPAVLRTIVVGPSASDWEVDDIVPLPSGFGNWEVTLGHNTGELTQDIINDHYDDPYSPGVYPWRRWSIGEYDGKPVIHERLDPGLVLRPQGFYGTHQSFSLTPYKWLLFRMHFRVLENWGCEGKYPRFDVGRGWAGDVYAKTGAAFGDTGCMLNIMHPVQSDTQINYCRGYCMKYVDPNSPNFDNFGYTVATVGSTSNWKYKNGLWIAVDAICGLGTSLTNYTGSWSLYFNGQLCGQTPNINVMRELNKVALGYHWCIRTMSGGTSENLVNNHLPGDHYYGGFFLARSTGL